MARNIRFFYSFNDDPTERTAVLRIDGFTSEGEVKERIGTQLGDRCLAQYMVMGRMEWAD